ncbi:Tat binding protein 1-interacting protein-domain-containing protein [Blastocladiella britannica]|nr:Tat binding protein 1-interacting protein-domain-containing protein [Blastocladiella britannica]
MPPKSNKNGDDPEEAVLQYLQRFNRPFGQNDIAVGLKDSVGKSAIAKALATLVEQQKVVDKPFGKTHVYWIAQNDDDMPPADELDAMETEVNDLKSTLPDLETAVAALRRDHAALVKTPTTPDLAGSVAAAREARDALQARLDRLRPVPSENGGPPPAPLVTSDMKADAEYERSLYRTMWQQRKKWCRDALSAITESMPKKPAQIMEELGFETDEMAGSAIENIPPPPPNFGKMRAAREAAAKAAAKAANRKRSGGAVGGEPAAKRRRKEE